MVTGHINFRKPLTTFGAAQGADSSRGSLAYDVFLCHNKLEKPIIKEIAESIELDSGLLFFLDAYSIPASVEFWSFIEDQMAKSAACALCLGRAGWGKTHRAEADLALARRAVDPNFRIIPVNLPGADPSLWREIYPDGGPDVNWVDLVAEPPSDTELEKLRRAIIGDLKAVANAPEALSPFMVRRQAAMWERSVRKDRSLLYRGAMLRKAMALAASQAEFVAVNSVPAFLKACADQERATFRWYLATAILALVVVSALGTLALFSRQAAVRQEHIAVARSLAVQAGQEIHGRQDERAALLARRAYLFDERYRGGSTAVILSGLRAVADLSTFANKLQSQAGVVRDFSPDATIYVAVSADSSSTEVYPLLQDGRPATDSATIGLPIRDASPLAFLEAGRQLVVRRSNGVLALVDLRSSPPSVRPLPLARIPDDAPFAVGGPYIAVPVAPESAGIVDTTAMESSVTVTPLGRNFRALAVAPSGNRLAAGTDDGSVVEVSLDIGTRKSRITAIPDGRVQALLFSPDSTRLVIGGQSSVYLWNLEAAGSKPERLAETPGSIDELAFSPSGDHLAAASSAGGSEIFLWRLSNSTHDGSTLPTQAPVWRLRFTRDGAHLLVAHSDGSIVAWRIPNPLRSNRELRATDFQVTLYPPRLFTVAAVPGTNSFVVGGGHGFLQYWRNILTDRGPIALADAREAVMRTSFAPEHVQQFQSGEHNYLLFGHIMAAAFAADGRRFFTVDAYGTVLVWPVPFSDPLRFEPTLIGMADSSTGWSIAVHPSGDAVYVGYGGGILRRYPSEPAIGGATETSLGSSIVRAVAYDPIRGEVLAGSDDGVIYTVRDDNGSLKVLGSYDVKSAIRFIALAPSHERMALATDGVVLLSRRGKRWEAGLRPVQGNGEALSVAWSRDGARLAATYTDGSVRIWETANFARPPTIIGGHAGYARAVAFTADGGQVLTAGDDSVIRLDTVDPKPISEKICDIVWRDLSQDEWRQFVGENIPFQSTCPARH